MTDQLEDVRSTLLELGQPVAEPEPQPLTEVDLSDCLTGELEPVPWVVPGWLAERDVAVLAGEPKTGKSWLALALSLSLAIAGGRGWLNIEAHAAPQRVLYVDEENNPRLVRYRVRKLAAGLGLRAADLAAMPLRYLSQNALNLDDEERLQAFWSDVREFRPNWVVLDSLVRFHRGDENSNTALAAFFADVVRPLVGHFESGVCILHHMAKPGKDRADLVHRIRGAGDIVAAADQVWTLERNGEDGAKLRHEWSRWAETAGELVVRIEDTEDWDGVVLSASCSEDATEDVVRDVLNDADTVGALRQEIVAAVKAAGYTDRAASKCLRQLSGCGRVQKRREGLPMRYWLSEYAPADLAD